MITSCEGKDSEMDLVTPPKKKLKQARLSFQKLSPGVDTLSTISAKKRKMSDDSGDDIKVLKVVKTNENSNLGPEKHSSSETTSRDNTPLHNDTSLNVDEENEKNDSRKGRSADVENEQTEEKIKSDVLSSNSDKNCVRNSTDKTPEVVKSKHLEEENKSNVESPSPDKECALDSIGTTSTIQDNQQTEDSDKSDVQSASPDKECAHDSTLAIETSSSSSESGGEEDSDNESELNATVDELNSSGSNGNDSANPVNDSTSHRETAAVSSDNVDENLRNDSICSPRGSVIANESIRKKLTPKQILRRQEIEKRREEREKRKMEKEELKAKEKEVKRKVRLENREKRRKEKEEKEEQKRKDKEEKEKKRQAELELKSEEKRLKEEEKRKKEEQKVLEKKKKDGKKIAEVEAKKKEAAAFANFFVAAKAGVKSSEDSKVLTAKHFMPFQIKADMRLAPILRTNFSEARAKDMEKLMKDQSEIQLYLSQLRRKNIVPGFYKKTWPLSDFRESVTPDDEDVIFVSEENKVVESHPSINQPKAKLLQFCENRRPPYWGTWRKKSKCLKPTKPFLKDEAFFDYEVDSDDEWEEEEPGESLHGSDDEKESEDEYEVDNEFFVPHGYLSEEENDGEEEEVMSPETMKAKLKLLEIEFEEEMKHKTERVKPRLFGCFWINENSNVDSKILGVLSSYRAVYKEMSIPVCETTVPDSNSPVSEGQCVSTPSSSKRKKFPESVVPDLIRLVHGNINGRGFLVKEFFAYLKSKSNLTKDEQNPSENDSLNTPPTRIASKFCISNKIKQITSWLACPEEGPFFNRMCWYVSAEIRSAYGLEDLVIPNKSWNYIITPKKELELSNTIPSPSVNIELKQKSLPLITKFTKKISQEERQKQLMPSQVNDDDIEVVFQTKVSSPQPPSNKTKNTDSISNSERSSVKNQSTDSAEKETGDCNGMTQKLLQFKAKPSTTPTQRKRVPILKSVPLGQKIVSANVTSTGNENKESKGMVLENGESSKNCP